MQDFVVYAVETGRIERTGQCSTITDCLLQHGGDPALAVALGLGSEETDYVIEQQITPRPAFSVDDTYSLDADGESVLSIALPAGTLVTLDGVVSDVGETGVLDLVGEVPATYVLGLSLWPFLDKTITVNCHAPDAH